MIRTNLHNRYFLIIASIVTIGRSAVLEFSDFSTATSGDKAWLKVHEFRLLHIWVAHRTIFVTECLRLSIRVPVIMSLVVPMVLLERVIQVTIHPTQLRNVSKVKWHLSVLSRLVVIKLSQGIHLLIEVRVNNFVSKIIVWSALVPKVLWSRCGVEIKCCH